MNEDIIQLKLIFRQINKMEYIKSINNNFSGIGTTFEKMIGKSGGNLGIPDFNSIEIKTRRAYSKFFITLFNAVPNNSEFEMQRIKNLYGYPDSVLKNCNIFYGSVYSDKYTICGIKFIYKLEIDVDKQKIYLCIFDLQLNLIEKAVYWSFDLLYKKLYTKIKVLALVRAWPNRIDGIIHYKYYKMDIYMLKNLILLLN